MSEHIDWSDVNKREIVLFSKGTRLAEVPPDFRGMPYKQYLHQRVTDIFAEYLAVIDYPQLVETSGRRDRATNR